MGDQPQRICLLAVSGLWLCLGGCGGDGGSDREFDPLELLRKASEKDKRKRREAQKKRMKALKSRGYYKKAD